MQDEGVVQGTMHVRIQQRNGRKSLTMLQGLSESYDREKILATCRKKFSCNGCIVDHPEYGKVLQFQGDQRQKIVEFLVGCNIANHEDIKVHGF